MKKALLDWEKSFEHRYNRKPTIADVQKRPDRGNLQVRASQQSSPKRPVEFIHSPNHPRSPHNRLLREKHQQQKQLQLQQQRQHLEEEQRQINEYVPRPLIFPKDDIKPKKISNNNNAKIQQQKVTSTGTTVEGGADVAEIVVEQAFWLDITVPELLSRQDSGVISQQQTQEDGQDESNNHDGIEQEEEQNDDNDDDEEEDLMMIMKKKQNNSFMETSADNLDDLFNDEPGNENWVNSEDLGPLAAYARQKKQDESVKKRRVLGNEELVEKRRKMKAMLEPYKQKNYDTLSPALAAERQAKRDREVEQRNEQHKPLQLAAATTKSEDDDFIVSHRVFEPVVNSQDIGLLRNNQERKDRFRAQLEAGTFGIPKPKLTPSPPSTQETQEDETISDHTSANTETTITAMNE
ncbi:hypothetical protein INT45_003764 [Circinella minor]|uniref:Uncharacterized protein n=1 Tax=Circinella minor TaxID=1195481 RepID=A0A8H7S6Q4_9FUNG|nr:hypothetical protein INT45_003764 [Circinella minor]